jgi:hypothetical protein
MKVFNDPIFHTVQNEIMLEEVDFWESLKFSILINDLLLSFYFSFVILLNSIQISFINDFEIIWPVYKDPGNIKMQLKWFWVSVIEDGY